MLSSYNTSNTSWGLTVLSIKWNSFHKWCSLNSRAQTWFLSIAVLLSGVPPTATSPAPECARAHADVDEWAHLCDGLAQSLEETTLAPEAGSCSLANCSAAQLPAPEKHLQVANRCLNPSCYPSGFNTVFHPTITDMTLPWYLYVKLATEAISTLSMTHLL